MDRKPIKVSSERYAALAWAVGYALGIGIGGWAYLVGGWVAVAAAVVVGLAGSLFGTWSAARAIEKERERDLF